MVKVHGTVLPSAVIFVLTLCTRGLQRDYVTGNTNEPEIPILKYLTRIVRTFP
jgi:hypothetical protein